MIDFKNKNTEKPIPSGSYPIDYQKIGDDEELFKIFIGKHTIEDIKSYLSSDKNIELGGVLIGEVYCDDTNNKFIVIEDMIIARYTEANVTRLTFTHNSWEYINGIMDRDFPQKKVLGWYHSHPGHTVFLSSYDKFIQENFFDTDFMVAYVFDPINSEEGFFFRKNDKLEKSNCFYVFSDSKTNKNIIENLEKNIIKEKKTKDGKLFFYFVFFISALSLIISVFLLYNYFDSIKIEKDLKVYESKIKELKEENSKINSKLEEIIMNNGKSSDSSKTVYSKNFIKHQVKPGETLRQLALDYYKDEGKYNLLIRHNNLKDEFDISVGQIIEIPME